MLRRARRWAIAALAPVLAAACAAPAAPAASPTPSAADATAVWLVRGAALYGEHCASCHGARGEGQPNWAVPMSDGSLPAPPHDATGHTWHHSDVELLRIIAEGGTFYDPKSKMPGFGAQLSGADQQAVLAHIKSFWGPREAAYQHNQSLQWNAEMAVPSATP